MEIRTPLDDDLTLACYYPHEKFLARAFGLLEWLRGVSRETRNQQLSSTKKAFLQFGDGGNNGFQPFPQAKVNVPSRP
jgi:hypothetical protein